MRTDRRPTAWMAALLLIALGGCTGGVPPTSVPPEAAAGPAAASPAAAPDATTSGPSATRSPSPTVEAPPSDLPPDIEAAIAWRLETGLRADPEWVVSVARDPTAVDWWAWPILPEEERFIWERQEWLHTFIGAIRIHADQHPDTFGGLYMDIANSRIMTLWTTDPDAHLAAILADAGPNAPIAARLVRWSEAELRRVQDSVDWHSRRFAEAQADPQGVGADIIENVVTVDVSSANPDAPALIAAGLAEDLDVPVEMLRVESDGTGVELLPSGNVKGVVVMADGSAPGHNNLTVDGDPDTIGYCGGGDIGYGVGEDGRFRIPCKVGAYTMEIHAPGEGDGEWIIVGQAHVTVREDEVTRVRIRLVEAADVGE